jgi:hypothetical protein
VTVLLGLLLVFRRISVINSVGRKTIHFTTKN